MKSELRWSPVVGVFGLRQVGKTTLVSELTQQLGGQLETLDRAATLDSAHRAPLQFCSRKKLLCIDEAQLEPALFPVIKELIGTKRKPGAFLLTGSVRFTAKERIRESLTGRILTHELLPFSIAESRDLSPGLLLQNMLSADWKDAAAVRNTLQKAVQLGRIGVSQINRFLVRGGLPTPCFTRHADQRTAWFQSYFETLLVRDLVLVDQRLEAIGLRKGLVFLSMLAQNQAGQVNVSELASRSSLGSNLVSRLLRALEILCIVDLIPADGLAKKSIKKQRLDWKDSGLWAHCAGIEEKGLANNEGLADQALRLTISHEIRSQLSLSNPQTQLLHFQTRDGASIPWVIRKGNRSLAIELINDESPKPYDYRSLKQFVERERNSLGVILGAPTAPCQPLAPRIWLLPYPALF